MSEKEYIQALCARLEQSARELLDAKSKWLIRGQHVEISDVREVRIWPQDVELKLSTALKGESFEVHIKGTASIQEKQENGSRSQIIEFWIRPATARYDHDSEKFEIIDVSKFNPVNIGRHRY